MGSAGAMPDVGWVPITAEERRKIVEYQQSLPVDVKGLAESLGIRVWQSSTLATDISGKLAPDRKNGGDSGYSIIVRAQDVYARKRFTIAHEIAHYLLHRNQIGTGVTDDQFYRSKLSSVQETEANKLAADILMPRHLIQSVINEGTTDIDLLASRFAVSKTAMMIRLGIPIP